jgi:adenosylcobinamide-GDP ribazoletransferase
MRWGELVGAFMLLTRLPVAPLALRQPAMGACIWAYPIVGLVVGGIGAGVFWFGARLGLSPTLTAVWAVCATTLATGALHEDGLADTADGFGGGATAARKLEIMRDSRIGSFGTVALLLSFTLRVVAIADSTDPVFALLLASVLGRGAIVIVLLALRPARTDGLAASLGMTPGGPAVAGLAIALLCGLAAWPALLCASAVAVAMAALARSQIGGYTGDVLGATEQLTECAVLTVLLIR